MVKRWIEEISVPGYLDQKLPLKNRAWTWGIQVKDLVYRNAESVLLHEWEGDLLH